MSATKKKKTNPKTHGGGRTSASADDPLFRVNTRIFLSQVNYIKREVARSKGQLSEGDVHRQLLQEGITSREGN